MCLVANIVDVQGAMCAPSCLLTRLRGSLHQNALTFCMFWYPDLGHALEAGWFLLQVSAERGDQKLQRTAIDKFLELPFKGGWDKDHGGLFYFLDVDQHCPTQVI